MLTRRIAPPPPLNPEFSLAREEELLGTATSQGHAVLFSFEQDYEERTAQANRVHAQAQAESQQQQRLAVLRAHLRLSPGFPTELRSDVVNFKAHIMREEDDDRVDSIVLATKLAAVGYDVVCRRALGASAGGSSATVPGACFHLLQYEFLIVKCNRGDYQGMELYVDPHFREQFEIPHPTPHYKQLLSSVPLVFVGSRVHLIAIVKLLCAAMAESFAARGLTLAPWRRTSAMLSKWQPLHAKDTPFTSAFHAPPAQQPPCQQAEEATWLPFGACAPVAPKPTPVSAPRAAAPAPKQQQQQQQECPFAEVRQRKAQEDMASQLANLDAWCNRLQASPAPAGLLHAAQPAVRPTPGSIAATAAGSAALPTAVTAAAPAAPRPAPVHAGAGPVSAPQPPAQTPHTPTTAKGQASPRPTSPTPSPTSPRSPSSGGKATSLLSSQLLQRTPSGNSGSHACVPPAEGAVTAGVSPVALGAAHKSQPILRKVQYVQRC